MESYLEQAPCIYFSSKDDGTLIDVNDTLCTRLGFCREELLGQRLDILFTVPTRIFQQTHFFPLLKIQGHAEEIYITLQTKDKEQIPVLINAERKAINGVAVNSYVGIIVHNRKKFEEELIAAKKAAEQALNENTTLIQTKQELQQHLEQLDHQINIVNKQNKELRQFNRVVTHDLQEPLRKLSVFSNILLEGKEKPEQRTIVQKIANVSEQMRSIISGLQQYIWLTETLPNITDVPLEDLLTSVRQQLENEFPQIHLIIDAEALPVVEGDREQMQVLFYQLLSNVVRFRKDEREAYVKISANNLMLNTFRNLREKYKYADYLRMQIQDNGIGFDAGYKDQVFELFKRLHPESGRGIGLALCKKIIENHNGDITIDSKEGEGTTVTILLPVQKNYCV